MSNKLVTMQQVRLIIHYLQRGVSGRKIAQELGLSRNTVKLYVDRILNSSLSLDAVHQMNDAALSDLVYPSLKTFSSDERIANAILRKKKRPFCQILVTCNRKVVLR